ncbi:hypothetical protein LY90DRAFT_517079 [Neocallimastix californiae]|uniref:Uncharacterized protein n=1 Tax=Neocallimastix californiae TaxID=1754190 RepID=A0A1Y2AC18_9FUNG|nr:hypothetical protein LY90DRAFT_517079 [Neocallimastix californiae]|eukprot:ORY20078.1 hypothetical protein LY90DRAFT_517079 [Neocallimastix californiae]
MSIILKLRYKLLQFLNKKLKHANYTKVEKECDDVNSNWFNSSGIDILFSQKIIYNSKVVLFNREFTEIAFYTRDFNATRDYKFVKVEMNIPFTGLDTSGSRARILAYIDDEVICDSTINTTSNWILYPLFISGFSLKVKKGMHKFKIKACVDRGALYIPHLNPDCIENLMEPKISCSLLITGIY